MINSGIVDLLESEWSEEDGFFWHIREGHFVPDSFARALRTVRSISMEEDALVPRRIVSLLWYIPTFMYWQVERVRESGGNTAEYSNAIATMTSEIERVLGVP